MIQKNIRLAKLNTHNMNAAHNRTARAAKAIGQSAHLTCLVGLSAHSWRRAQKGSRRQGFFKARSRAQQSPFHDYLAGPQGISQFEKS